jgi:AcrR family transcriptional regulator
MIIRICHSHSRTVRMKPAQRPVVAARKAPRQRRSRQLVEDILEAAIRVLSREGAGRFTTARVAETAGVSVGSLYQYFPNKEAILFRLQTDEWKRTSDLMHSILADTSLEPLDRLRATVAAFFLSEWEEASLRVALGDAAPSYKKAPEVEDHRKAGRERLRQFMAELLPDASVKERRFATDILVTTMSVVGKKVSEQSRSRAEVEAWSRAIGEMLCAYSTRLMSRI